MNLDKVSEDIDYELIPVTESDNTQAWEVRILKGPFVETVIRYGNVRLDGRGRDACLKFNFMVSSSPVPDLEPETNEELQDWAADILEDIIEQSFGRENGINLREASED